MDNNICLDKNYSTTRLLTKEKPTLEQNSEYKLEPKLFLVPNFKQKIEDEHHQTECCKECIL